LQECEVICSKRDLLTKRLLLDDEGKRQLTRRAEEISAGEALMIEDEAMVDVAVDALERAADLEQDDSMNPETGEPRTVDNPRLWEALEEWVHRRLVRAGIKVCYTTHHTGFHAPEMADGRAAQLVQLVPFGTAKLQAEAVLPRIGHGGARRLRALLEGLPKEWQELACKPASLAALVHLHMRTDAALLVSPAHGFCGIAPSGYAFPGVGDLMGADPGTFPKHISGVLQHVLDSTLAGVDTRRHMDEQDAEEEASIGGKAGQGGPVADECSIHVVPPTKLHRFLQKLAMAAHSVRAANIPLLLLLQLLLLLLQFGLTNPASTYPPTGRCARVR
jgi:hypothetical protein